MKKVVAKKCIVEAEVFLSYKNSRKKEIYYNLHRKKSISSKKQFLYNICVLFTKKVKPQMKKSFFNKQIKKNFIYARFIFV